VRLSPKKKFITPQQIHWPTVANYLLRKQAFRPDAPHHNPDGTPDSIPSRAMRRLTR
jgi:hypothetical protein